ncbi:MAG: hypothetical protein RIQ94_786 [Pseudomonadota bacterium]
MRRYPFIMLFVFILFFNSAFAVIVNPTKIQIPRGAMLYENHCIACHTQQIHWREKKQAYDWKSLLTQVDNWQRFSKLNWGKNDIEEVSHHLNIIYYHYPFSIPDQ